MKTCSKCGLRKDLIEFYTNRQTKDLHQSHCKKCHIAYVKTTTKKYKQDNPLKCVLYNAKTNARLSGRDFDIDESDIVIPELCPILGVKLERGTNYGPSIDRIDNSKGYIKGNIQVISRQANVMKSSATPEELLKFASWVQQTYGGTA